MIYQSLPQVFAKMELQRVARSARSKGLRKHGPRRPMRSQSQEAAVLNHNFGLASTTVPKS
ncbi:hypothetical protein MJO28_013335 [Puccinia striiformis f. sp. tritici]|uniref:Uncharacterized protein n=1 Tax=Puccinia striiformis f. sp. tritici TaxID=168172 RepID=A0ACC0DZ84_9BASI|nr:hypothetical protein MJO28_013335 [Puccinia striiformis f. sp. tritici]